MTPRILTVGLPLATAFIGVVAIGYWLTAIPPPPLQPRLPGQDRPVGQPKGTARRAPLEGKLVPGSGQPSALPGAWPRFRGPNLDAIWEDPSVTLARQWDADRPRRIWAISVGEGYAAAAVQEGRVYLIDYDREKEEEVVRCLSLDDGRDVWQFRYPNPVKRNHGMSRTIPTVFNKYVVTIGPKCHVACLNRLTGEPFWLLDMAERWGATVPPWYTGQCPLVEGGRVILAPGGPEALMVALNAETGEEIWRCPNPRNWKMTHSSIMPVVAQGRRMYVYCASGGVAAVDAETGKLLWDTPEWKISLAAVPSPLPLPENRIFLCGGYDAGAMMLKVANQDGKLLPEILFRMAPERFGSTQQTPVFYQGFIYGVREKDKQMVCFDPQGNERWASGSQYRFGLGPYMITNGLLLALDDEGTLTMAEAKPDAFHPLAQAKVLDGHDCWGPMAIVKGRLIVRSMTEMVCLDLTSP